MATSQTGPKITLKFRGTKVADLPPLENRPSYSTTNEINQSPNASISIPPETKKRSAETTNAEEERPRQQPRRIPTPGATQAAIARLAELNNNQSRASPPATTNPQQQHPRRIPTPGATQAAIARLSNIKTTQTGSSKRIHAPGATQAAIARLAALNPSSRGIHSSNPAFPEGTVVWAKMQSYPWWPAIVQVPTPEQARIKHTQNDIFVIFYGSGDYIWLPRSDVKLFSESSPEYSKYASAKNKALQNAIDEAWLYGMKGVRPDIMGQSVL